MNHPIPEKYGLFAAHMHRLGYSWREVGVEVARLMGRKAPYQVEAVARAAKKHNVDL